MHHQLMCIARVVRLQFGSVKEEEPRQTVSQAAVRAVVSQWEKKDNTQNAENENDTEETFLFNHNLFLFLEPCSNLPVYWQCLCHNSKIALMPELTKR